jgi:hypothetical protein
LFCQVLFSRRISFPQKFSWTFLFRATIFTKIFVSAKVNFCYLRNFFCAKATIFCENSKTNIFVSTLAYWLEAALINCSIDLLYCRYVGEVMNKEPWGQGRMVYASGSEYQGTWENGLRCTVNHGK